MLRWESTGYTLEGKQKKEHFESSRPGILTKRSTFVLLGLHANGNFTGKFQGKACSSMLTFPSTVALSPHLLPLDSLESDRCLIEGEDET